MQPRSQHLIDATERGDLKEVTNILAQNSALLNRRGGSKFRTAFATAAANGHLEIVKYLFSIGADSQILDPKCSTPLILAAQGGHIEILKYFFQEKIASDIDSVNKVGLTALIAATKNKHRDVVELLLKNNAKPKQDSGFTKDSTALHTACRKGYKWIIRMLSDAGADRNQLNVANQSPQDIAESLDDPKKRARAIAAFANSDRFIRDVQQDIANGRNPIHTAVKTGDVYRVRAVLGMGLYLRDIESFEYDIHAIDENGQTPIMLARSLNLEGIFNTLLEAGAIDEASAAPPTSSPEEGVTSTHPTDDTLDSPKTTSTADAAAATTADRQLEETEHTKPSEQTESAKSIDAKISDPTAKAEEVSDNAAAAPSAEPDEIKLPESSDTAVINHGATSEPAKPGDASNTADTPTVTTAETASPAPKQTKSEEPLAPTANATANAATPPPEQPEPAESPDITTSDAAAKTAVVSDNAATTASAKPDQIKLPESYNTGAALQQAKMETDEIEDSSNTADTDTTTTAKTASQAPKQTEPAESPDTATTATATSDVDFESGDSESEHPEQQSYISINELPNNLLEKIDETVSSFTKITAALKNDADSTTHRRDFMICLEAFSIQACRPTEAIVAIKELMKRIVPSLPQENKLNSRNQLILESELSNLRYRLKKAYQALTIDERQIYCPKNFEDSLLWINLNSISIHRDSEFLEHFKIYTEELHSEDTTESASKHDLENKKERYPHLFSKNKSGGSTSNTKRDNSPGAFIFN